MKSVIALALTFCLLGSSAFAEVLTFQCVFEYRIDAEGKTEELMPLEFKVDTFNKRSFMEGNAGIVDVGIHVGDDAVSFTERLFSGAIQTTTITNGGLAVHSRNTIIAGEFVAAQHFGRCNQN